MALSVQKLDLVLFAVIPPFSAQDSRCARFGMLGIVSCPKIKTRIQRILKRFTASPFSAGVPAAVIDANRGKWQALGYYSKMSNTSGRRNDSFPYARVTIYHPGVLPTRPAPSI